MLSRPQKLLAEFAGTFAIVFFSAGAICLDQFIRNRGGAGLGAVALALAYGIPFGIACGVVARGSNVEPSAAPARAHGYCGYFNPAVTLAHWAIRRLGLPELLLYSAAELAGAAAAGYLLRFATPEAIWRACALGTPDLRNGLTRAPGMLVEGATTLFLVLAVFAIIAGGRRLQSFAGVVTGLVVTTGVFFSLPFTGGSMNPAREFGPALAAHHWTNHGVYWIGPLAGGVAAAWIYEAASAGKRTSTHLPNSGSNAISNGPAQDRRSMYTELRRGRVEEKL